MAKVVCNFYSYVLMRAVDITVVLPSVTCPESLGMGEGPASHELKAKFPVLYLLHGFGNNHAQWTGYTNVEMYAEERRIAVVNISAENKAYSQIGSDDFVRFLQEELPAFVKNYFPISDKPEETYIAGLSMGGYGALLHGLSHPEKYRAIGAFSAGVNINPVSFAKNPMGGEQVKLPEEYDLHALAKKLKAEGKKAPKIYDACGANDFMIRDNEEYAQELKELGYDVTWKKVPGFAHEWRFWDQQIEQFLDWIERDDYYGKKGKCSV